MTLRIGCKAPNFKAETTEGVINFHEWIGDGWAVLFSNPSDSPVCTTETELGYVASLREQFERRNCKILGLSVNRVEDHALDYPLVADPKHKVAKAYGVLPADTNVYGEMGLVLDIETSAGRSDGEDAAVRSVFVIGPDKRIKAMLTYPMSTGRDFDEVLRILDSCQLTAKAPRPYPVFAPQPQ
jgi:alkyl hydroperoxide reductase subunit AhpC